MTKKFLPILFTALLFIISCVNNNEEPKVDCSSSDLSLSVDTSVKAGCTTAGSVTLIASGGSSNYTYSSDGTNFQSSATLVGLIAGDFTFLAKDADGCTASVSFTLEAEANAISLSLAATASDCSVDNGGIMATASGGVGTLSYALDTEGFQGASSFSNISSGTHKVTVKDEAGCEVSKDIQVEANVSLSTDIAPIINSNCAISGCHVSGSQSPNLSSSSGIINSAGRVKARTSARTMPLNGSLTDSEIDIIACWVDAGAKNN